ncbi:MAG: hypothetical protein Q8Q31_05080 [Nanoarchaeota archaeon]|nr:hypothetical protein [Nanoarchaeota archaeon]
MEEERKCRIRRNIALTVAIVFAGIATNEGYKLYQQGNERYLRVIDKDNQVFFVRQNQAGNAVFYNTIPASIALYDTNKDGKVDYKEGSQFARHMGSRISVLPSRDDQELFEQVMRGAK